MASVIVPPTHCLSPPQCCRLGLPGPSRAGGPCAATPPATHRTSRQSLAAPSIQPCGPSLSSRPHAATLPAAMGNGPHMDKAERVPQQHQQTPMRSATPQRPPPRSPHLQQGRVCRNNRSLSPRNGALSPPVPTSMMQPMRQVTRFSLHVSDAGRLAGPGVVRMDSTPAQRQRFIAVPYEAAEAATVLCSVQLRQQQVVQPQRRTRSPAEARQIIQPSAPTTADRTPPPNWRDVAVRATPLEFGPPDFSHLRQLPEFQPPDFQYPLPVPESPEPSPLMSDEVFLSPLPASSRSDRPALSGWLIGCRKQSQKPQLWPQIAEGDMDSVSLASCGNDDQDDDACRTALHPVDSPACPININVLEGLPKTSSLSKWLEGIPKTSSQCAFSPSPPAAAAVLSPTPACSANGILESDSAECYGSPGSLETDAELPTQECQKSTKDELIATTLVFPEVELGAVIAPEESPPWKSIASLAPLPADIPTPLGLSCDSALGVMSTPFSTGKLAEQSVPDSSAFAWFLPVPESPESTPANSAGTIEEVYSYSTGRSCQSVSAPQLPRLASTGGTGEHSVKGRPCSLGEMEEISPRRPVRLCSLGEMEVWADLSEMERLTKICLG